jgi:hypothetical protein
MEEDTMTQNDAKITASMTFSRAFLTLMLTALLLNAVVVMQAQNCYAAEQEHPFLLVKQSEYTELRNKASQEPWKAMKAKAITNANNLTYNPL